MDEHDIAIEDGLNLSAWLPKADTLQWSGLLEGLLVGQMEVRQADIEDIEVIEVKQVEGLLI